MWALSLLLTISPTEDPAFDAGPDPRLMRDPTLSKNAVAFAFAGDIWTVPRNGGRAIRLTSSPGIESRPRFSPDGSMIAFSGQYDGNTDVFVIPAAGGMPRRLTYHPAPDQVSGWTPDGQSVVFSSSMVSNTVQPMLHAVSIKGGLPRSLPFPSGTEASYSPDCSQIAYVPFEQWQNAWKRYRGGQTFPIWIGSLADSKVREIPRKNSNDKNPMWVRDDIYFLSDRKGPFGLYRYSTKTGHTAEEIPGEGFDIKTASTGPGGIVYEKLGGLYLYDFATRKPKRLEIEIDADFPEYRPQIKSLIPHIASGSISPSGARAVFEARGRIFTVPSAKGDARELSAKDGVAKRSPAWSPDGKTIAFLSDESGEYKLVLHSTETNEERTLELGQAPAFYSGLTWSPNSGKIAYKDNRFNLWVLDVATGKNTLIDTFTYEDLYRSVRPNWSRDSKWLTWHRDLDSHLNAVFLYSLEANTKTRITDGLSDARSPIFDRGGDYLYFLSSTNAAPSLSWLDLSSKGQLNITSSVYAVPLRKDVESPGRLESDEEGGTGKAQKKQESFRIDLEGIGRRAVSLIMPTWNYLRLEPGPTGSFFALEVGPRPIVGSKFDFSTDTPVTLWRYSVPSRSFSQFAQQVSGLDVSPSGEKMLLVQGAQWSIVPTAAPQPSQGALDLNGLTTKIDPAQEWRQIYREAWRIQRDYFYDPNYHGIDLKQMEKRYEPFLAGLRSRSDLNYLFEDMLGELCVGHLFIGGGDIPQTNLVRGGLLGADFKLEANRHRFTRIYDGENWNPKMKGPLTQPGAEVAEGEYLLAIDGKALTAQDDIYQRLEGTAGRQIRLTVGPNPSETNTREVTVVPVAEDFTLRNLAWVEDNRRTVERLSDGKLGYVHLSDTATDGFSSFNRFYFAQIDKQGMVIDERFNGGGLIDDYMVEQMMRPLSSMWSSRFGKDFPSPAFSNLGPKVMIVNQFSGSGGDYFPWHFKQRKVGPIVGKRTWGGLVAILNYPTFVDGGFVKAPTLAFYNLDGEWELENRGVEPNIDVELDPYLWRQGRDAQLEKAVEVALDRLKSWKRPILKKPPYPDRTKVGG